MTKWITSVAALVAMSAAIGAQGQAAREGEITLVGCVEMERDYRARKDAGRGGALGSGVGVGNEFILTNARPAARGRGQAVGTAGGAGTDYEITGKLEKDLLRYVGRQVEVIGTIDKGSTGLSTINVTLWHPVGDYCPGK